MKKKILFVCVHNSARSQMAEAFLNEICGNHFEARSAGLEPGKLNLLAVEAMREIGIDISHKQTQSVFDVFKSGPAAAGFAYVITVCDESGSFGSDEETFTSAHFASNADHFFVTNSNSTAIGLAKNL